MPKHKLPPWLQPKPKPSRVGVGVAWYTEEQWEKVKAASVDSERFEESYAAWVEMAEDAIRKMQVAGIFPIRVQVVAEELLAWCLAHNKKNSAASRAQFVSELGVKQPHEGDT
jgi:hypothetical protein